MQTVRASQTFGRVLVTRTATNNLAECATSQQLLQQFVQRQYKHSATATAAVAAAAVDDVINIPYSPGKSSTLKPFSEIPGPKGLPLIGTLWDYLKKDGLRFDKMFEGMQTRSKEFGPIYKEKYGPMESVVISDPDEYLKVINVDGKTPRRLQLLPMAHYLEKKKLGLGTTNGQGEDWYRLRTIIVKKTLPPREILSHADCMNEVANDFMKRMHTIRTSAGSVPKFEHEIFKWALESLGSVLFDHRIGCFSDPPPQLAEVFIANLLGFFKYMQPLMFNLPVYKVYPTKMWRTYEKCFDTVLEVAKEYVNKRVDLLKSELKDDEDREVTPTFLTYMLSQTTLSHQEIISVCVDLMMGGVETTSNAFLWTLYRLAKNPEAQEALYKNTMEILPDNAEITAEKLQSMQYVKACLKETFRICPLVHTTSRFIAKDIECCGYHIPAGTHCQANLYGMGRDEKLFSDPLRYQPERWLRENKEGETRLKFFSSLTFGHGPRMCLGRRLAEQEIYILLTKVIQKFKVECTDDVDPILTTILVPERTPRFHFVPRM